MLLTPKPLFHIFDHQKNKTDPVPPLAAIKAEIIPG
jgi:hypothetical protein